MNTLRKKIIIYLSKFSYDIDSQMFNPNLNLSSHMLITKINQNKNIITEKKNHENISIDKNLYNNDDKYYGLLNSNNNITIDEALKIYKLNNETIVLFKYVNNLLKECKENVPWDNNNLKWENFLKNNTQFIFNFLRVQNIFNLHKYNQYTLLYCSYLLIVLLSQFFYSIVFKKKSQPCSTNRIENYVCGVDIIYSTGLAIYINFYISYFFFQNRKIIVTFIYFFKILLMILNYIHKKVAIENIFVQKIILNIIFNIFIGKKLLSSFNNIVNNYNEFSSIKINHVFFYDFNKQEVYVNKKYVENSCLKS